MKPRIPTAFRKLVVKKLTPVFKEAVEITQENIIRPQSNEVLLKTKYVGINASDINVAAGRYFRRNSTLPFEVGFEGIGEIVDLGENVSDLKYGQSVMHMNGGAFAEYVCLKENDVIPIPYTSAEFLPLLVSGTTASLSLDKAGLIVPGEKVLITAAAGGAGHIAVQWAKNAGCHVIGTCSSQEKVKFLESIGCDRPINYNEEALENVLKKEYPDGINIIWETVGGKMFDILYRSLAVKGRLVIVGSTSHYAAEKFSIDVKEDILSKLLIRSSTISGFFLPHYKGDMPHYLSILVRLFHEQKLKLHVDDGSLQGGKAFDGLEDITRAVEYLYSRKSQGKVVVPL